jgi:hypothetical protein
VQDDHGFPRLDRFDGAGGAAPSMPLRRADAWITG